MNGFESVNLDSTVLDEGRKESASTTSDEEDLNPHDFITSEPISESSDSHVIPGGLTDSDEDSHEYSHEYSEDSRLNLIDDLLTSTVSNDASMADPSVILDFPKPPNITHSGENMVQFMLSKCQSLQQELIDTTRLQDVYINEGNDNLDQTRLRIQTCLTKLSEAYYSLHELYQRERNYVTATYASFNQWDQRRAKLLAKISDIKSTSSKYGNKLASLLDDSITVDNEIAELESKLSSLRNKKLVLNAEINSTSSVLESKTSKHVTMFRDLDQMGYEALFSFLNELGVSEGQIHNIIDYATVDVTFMNKYKASSKKAQELAQSNDTIKGSASNANSNSKSKPTSLPPPPSTPLSPYEKGFAKGSNSSKKIRNRVLAIFQTYLPNDKHQQYQSTDHQLSSSVPHIPKTNELQVDDEQNTISTKLNLEPILLLLKHKEQALQDLDLQASKIAANYHQCEKAWSDLQLVLALQERKLLSYLEASTNMQADGVKNTTVSIIETSINQIQSTLERNNFKEFDPTLKLAIVNEIRALIAAINLVANVDLSNSLASLARVGISEEWLLNDHKSQHQYTNLRAHEESTTISNDLTYFGIPLVNNLVMNTNDRDLVPSETFLVGTSKQIKKE